MTTSFLSLEEKLSDLEAEDQVLQHQALFSSSSRKMSEHLEITSLVRCLVFFLNYFSHASLWKLINSFPSLKLLQHLQNGHHVSEKNNDNLILFKTCLPLSEYSCIIYRPDWAYFSRNHQPQQECLVLMLTKDWGNDRLNGYMYVLKVGKQFFFPDIFFGLGV